MDSTMGWDERLKEIEGIADDRRGDRRYEIHLALRWKLIRRRRVLDTGVGHTLDLSSGGILFDPGRQFPVGLKVELSIAWPVLLHNVAPLQLIVSGRLVRCAGTRSAIQMVQHEFRTMGISAERRGALSTAARTPSVLLSQSSGVAAMGKW